MAIVGGPDVHRSQVTFDVVDTGSSVEPRWPCTSHLTMPHNSPMSNLWYVAAGLLFGALFGAVAGWLNPPNVSARALWAMAVLFLVAAVAFGVLAAVPATSSSGSSSNDGSVHCPNGTTDSQPSTAPIADVKVTPINSVEVCLVGKP